MLEVRLSSLRLPQTSHTFNFDSSGTARATLSPLGLITLPATLAFAAETATNLRMDGNA